eukprot:3977300-Lingulodinium_polyedra.AAC.1
MQPSRRCALTYSAALPTLGSGSCCVAPPARRHCCAGALVVAIAAVGADPTAVLVPTTVVRAAAKAPNRASPRSLARTWDSSPRPFPIPWPVLCVDTGAMNAPLGC